MIVSGWKHQGRHRRLLTVLHLVLQLLVLSLLRHAAGSTLGDVYWLFGVVSGSACAEKLPYGPNSAVSSGYLSTKYKDVTHDSWIQDVYVSGSFSFRVYWYFNTSSTTRSRFVNAVSTGESVLFIVDQGTGSYVQKQGTWRFSSSSGISSSMFDVLSTTSYFSTNSGAWGAGSGVVDGASSTFAADTSFWGQANVAHSSSDGSCLTVYKDGVGTTATKVVSYLYTNGASLTNYPTKAPTAGPTSRPTVFPTANPSSTHRPTLVPTGAPTSMPTTLAPSRAPTPSPPLPSTTMGSLFAVTTGSQCAESLPYGPAPQPLHAPANAAFFDTSRRDIRHTGFLQIVTNDGSTEDFRIYYAFSTTKTLRQRMLDAVRHGEPVNFTVAAVSSPTAYRYEYYTGATWSFSSAAGLSWTQFNTKSNRATGFSANNGVWGAGPSTLDGAMYDTLVWGHGVQLSSDAVDCSSVYRGGVKTRNDDVVSYMYLIGESESVAVTARSTTPSFLMAGRLPVAARLSILLIACLVIVGSVYVILRTRHNIQRQVELTAENPTLGRRQGRKRGQQQRVTLSVTPQQRDDPGEAEDVVCQIDEYRSPMHVALSYNEDDEGVEEEQEDQDGQEQHGSQPDPPPHSSPPADDAAVFSGPAEVQEQTPGPATGGGSRVRTIPPSLHLSLLHMHGGGGGVTRVGGATVSPLFRNGRPGEADSDGPMEEDMVHEDNGDDELVCELCSERNKAVAFVPCGHRACVDCASARVGKHCPTCQTRIKKTRRIFDEIR